MFKHLKENWVIYFMCGVLVALLLTYTDAYFKAQESKAIEAQKITLEEVLEKSECGYIVKDVETWSILEPNVYLDEEVVEIAVCCDTEDTLCIFISLPTDQERVIVRNP